MIFEVSICYFFLVFLVIVSGGSKLSQVVSTCFSVC